MKSWLLLVASAVAFGIACGSNDSDPFASTSTSTSSVTSTSSTGGSSGAGGGPLCEPTLESIQQTIFQNSCAGTSCHNATDTAGDLDLVSAGLESRLIDVAAGTCNGLRVAPGKPEESFLFEKVSNPKPQCGDPMPIGASLSTEELGCISDWIASLSGGCETCSSGGCVDTMTDSAHCGGCGQACTEGTSCKLGVCVCDNGGLDCGGVCTLVESDPMNCGACGTVCNQGEVCLAGACSAEGCGALTQCGSSCIDVATDAKNCGDCGVECAPAEACQSSKCVCPGAKDFMTDPMNCGACGVVCGQGETCSAGKCACGDATVSFAQAVEPILTKNCGTAVCHSGAMPKGGLDLSTGKSYGNLVTVKASQCNDGRLRVKPGSPGDSYLLDKILGVDLCSGTKMPKNTNLSDPDTQTIVNWICGGALND